MKRFLINPTTTTITARGCHIPRRAHSHNHLLSPSSLSFFSTTTTTHSQSQQQQQQPPKQSKQARKRISILDRVASEQPLFQQPTNHSDDSDDHFSTSFSHNKKKNHYNNNKIRSVWLSSLLLIALVPAFQLYKKKKTWDAQNNQDSSYLHMTIDVKNNSSASGSTLIDGGGTGGTGGGENEQILSCCDASQTMIQLLEELCLMNQEAQSLEKQISNLGFELMNNDLPFGSGIKTNSDQSIEMKNEMEYLVQQYRGLIRNMSHLTEKMSLLSDEEFVSMANGFTSKMSMIMGSKGDHSKSSVSVGGKSVGGALPLAQLDRSNDTSLSTLEKVVAYDVLRSCILLNLNAKTILRESPGSEDTSAHVRFDLERMHFNVMTILNRLILLREDYAERIVDHKMVGPFFNTLLRCQSNSLRQLAADVLCNLADRYSTHDKLVEWVTTFRFMVESDNNLSLYTAAYMMTRMFCNENMRELLSQTQFLPYTNLLEDVFSKSKDKKTKMYSSFGVFLSQGKLKQQKFLVEKERNEAILDNIYKVMFIAGTSFAWAALRIRLKKLPLAPNYSLIGKSTMVSTLLGSTFILRDEIKDRSVKSAHEKFHQNPNDLSIKVPPISIIHSSLIAFLQILAVRSGIPFILAPYLLHALYFELQPKGTKTHQYQLFWEHMIRRSDDALTRKLL